MKKSLKFVGMSLFAALLILLPFASCTNSSGGTQSGGETSSGGQQQEDKAAKFGGKPYDATIGNGGYNLHTFMGANTTFDSKEKADYYINQAEAYVKGLANKLNDATRNRPEAQAYFSQMVNGIQSVSYKSYSFDVIISNVSHETAKIMGDITKNMETKKHARAFEGCYRTIANEALKAGAGNAFAGSDSASRYNTEKNYVLELAAATKIGHNVTADDLRQVINIAMTTESFYALHSRTQTALNHKNSDCTYNPNIIRNKIDPSKYTYAMLNKQDNGIELC